MLPNRMTPKTTLWLYRFVKKWNTHFNNSVQFCLYLLFDWCFASTASTMHWYSLNLSNTKPISVIKISVYLHFLHCVHIWDKLACLWGQLCMVTLSSEWRLNHMQIWLSADWWIFVKMKWLHSWASEPCSLVLKVQALNVHVLTHDGGKDLRMC